MAPPTWTVGPPGGPGGPGGPSKPNLALIAGIAVAVLLVVGLGVFALNQNKDDETAGSKRSGSSSSMPPTTDREQGPNDPTTSAPGTGSGGGGGEDLTARAQKVAGQTFDAANVDPSTVDCMTDAFVSDPDLLAAVEPVSDAVLLESPDDAAAYAELVMGCASPQDLNIEFVQGLAASGELDQSSLVCIDAALASYTSSDWVDFLTAVLQTSRQGEVQSVLSDAITYC